MKVKERAEDITRKLSIRAEETTCMYFHIEFLQTHQHQQYFDMLQLPRALALPNTRYKD